VKFYNWIAALIAFAVIILGLSTVCNADELFSSWVQRFGSFLPASLVYAGYLDEGQKYFIEVSLNERWHEYGFKRGILRFVRLSKGEVHPDFHEVIETRPIYQFQSFAIPTKYGSYIMMLGHYMVNDVSPNKVVKIPGVERRYFWDDPEGVMFLIQRYDPEQYAFGFIRDTKRIDIYSTSPLLPVLLPPEFVNRMGDDEMTQEDVDFANWLYLMAALGARYD